MVRQYKQKTKERWWTSISFNNGEPKALFLCLCVLNDCVIIIDEEGNERTNCMVNQDTKKIKINCHMRNRQYKRHMPKWNETWSNKGELAALILSLSVSCSLQSTIMTSSMSTNTQRLKRTPYSSLSVTGWLFISCEPDRTSRKTKSKWTTKPQLI